MASSTVENYVKQIYLAHQRQPGELVPMGQLATTMGVVPGTATSMIKALSSGGLVDYEPRSGVRLTAGGEQLALHVLRRHRLVELLLVEILGLDWSQVHEEAEQLEHVISDRVLEKIDVLLGRPQTDPHGDPIPSSQGVVTRMDLDSLMACDTGARVTVVRVTRQSPEFLRFVNEAGLMPGVTVVVLDRDAQAEATTVQTPGHDAVTLGAGAAERILVRAAAAE